MSKQEISDNRLTLMGYKPSYVAHGTGIRQIMENNAKTKFRHRLEQLKGVKISAE